MKYALTILLLALPAFLFAQDAVDLEEIDTTIFNVDSADYEDSSIAPTQLVASKEYRGDSLQLKAFDSAQWKKIIGDSDFNERVVEEKRETTGSSYDIPWNGFGLKVISYIIIIAVGVMTIYYLVTNMRFSRRTIRNAARPSDPDLPIDNIEEFDMKRLVDEALRGGELALAVRYYYLGLLKKLHGSGKIVWKKDKTNFDYLTELFSKGYYYQEVRTLTHAYETIWYGERAVSRVHYDRLISDFEEIHSKLGESKTNEH